MSTEENKAIVRRYQEAFNSNNLDALDEIVAADIRSQRTTPGMPPGLEGGKMSHRSAVAAVPNLHYQVEDLIAEGDKVVMRWTLTGTHSSDNFIGFPPSGKPLRITGINIFRITGGKIVEHWAEPDGLGLTQQLEENAKTT